MKTYDATEQAYKNGYEDGYKNSSNGATKRGRCVYCSDSRSFVGAKLLLGNDGKWHDINFCPNCGERMIKDA